MLSWAGALPWTVVAKGDVHSDCGASWAATIAVPPGKEAVRKGSPSSAAQ